ncbi:MAG TPA: inositol oxygenase family protein, partial [Acidimicrobiia bacterium]|nr:inositol oxygenase family protein [Acidimicrobiia bacterium]
MTAGFADVDALFDALRASAHADDEGGLPILDHCLQCAAGLRSSHPGDTALQVAGLVHDLGWLELV